MSTAAQILANQQNAQHSTGPQTAEGKAASAANATRHGLAGAFRVLAHEDQSEFDRLLADYRADFSPKSSHETFLVEEMAQSRWKLARFRRLEAVVVDQMISGAASKQSPDEIIVAAPVNNTAKAFTTLQRYATAAERSNYRAHRELIQGRERARAEAKARESLIIQQKINASREFRNEAKSGPPALSGKRLYTAPGENLALRL